jgi:flagellar biosynthesis protein FlhB
MAKDDKTEPATPKRKNEARKKGQVAKSNDLNGSFVVLAGLFAISATGPAIVGGIAASMRDTFAHISSPSDVISGPGLKSLYEGGLHTLMTTAAPVALTCMAVGVMANIGQVGFKPSISALKPDIKRVNPLTGAKNLFSTRALFELGKSLTKVALVGAVAAMTLVPQITHFGASIGTSPAALGSLMGSNALAVAQRAAIAYVFIGIVDLVWQRRKHNQQLKMTKQEVKDEAKQYDLPPEVRGAIRRRQREAARARMMAAVPQADVVVTNPTHYAVALSYDGTRPAPVVVAKGRGYVALQIRRIAEENGVAIVPDPPLARSLHASVELDQMIPEEFYAAVAQVLAFVYRTAGRRKAAVAAR